MSSVLARAVVVLEGDAKALDKVMSAAEKRVMKAGELMQQVGSTLTTHVTLPIVAAGALAVKAFGEEADAIAKMNAVIQATGGASGVTTEHMRALSAQLQQTTRFADEVTMGASAFLLTLKNVSNVAGQGNDVFDRTVKISQDLAGLMEGDLQGAMFLVGKAMEDPAEGLQMLQRRTRAFTDAQEEQIKKLMEQGRHLEAQKIILQALEGRIGGTAAAMAKTPFGQFKQAWNAIGDALEQVGAILMEVLVPAAQLVKRWAIAFQGLSADTKRTIVIMAAVVAAIGPVLVTIGVAIKTFTMLSVVLGAMAGPVALAVVALGSLVAAGVAIAQHWVWLKQQAVALWAFIKDVFFKGVDFILQIASGLLSIVAPGLAATAAILRTELGLAAEESMASSGRALAGLEQQLMATEKAATQAGKAMTAALKPPPPPPPTWLKGAQDAVKDFTKAMSEAKAMQQLLGKGFNFLEAEAAALEGVVQALIASGVDLNSKTDEHAIKLREYAQRLLAVRAEMKAIEEAQNAYNDTMQRAKALVEDSLTPTQVYEQKIRDLNAAVEAGVIQWHEYDAAVRAAQEALKESETMGAQLSQAIADIAGRGVDSFVEFAFGAKRSFKEFVKEAIMELTKLILKIQLMKLLFPDAGASGIGKLFGKFASGGFLPAGEIGLVGERGPELVMAGHGGVQITPLPANRAAGPADNSMAGNITLNVNVNAIDSRDAGRFFEENEGMVAGMLLRAVQKSQGLRRQLGGG